MQRQTMEQAMEAFGQGGFAPPRQLPGSHYNPAVPFVTARNPRNDVIITDRVVDASKVSILHVVDFSERHCVELRAIADDRRQRRRQSAAYDRRVRLETADEAQEALREQQRIALMMDRNGATPTKRCIPRAARSDIIAHPSEAHPVPSPYRASEGAKSNGAPLMASTSLWMKMADACRGNPDDPQFWQPREKFSGNTTRRIAIADEFEKAAIDRGEEDVNGDEVERNVEYLKRCLLPHGSDGGIEEALQSSSSSPLPSRHYDPTGSPVRPLEGDVSTTSRSRFYSKPAAALANMTLAQQLPMFLANLTLSRLAGRKEDAEAAAVGQQRYIPRGGKKLHHPFTELEKLMAERDWGVDDILVRLGFSLDVLQRIDRLLASPKYLMQCYPDGHILSRYVTLESVSINALVASRKQAQQQNISIMNDGDADGGDDYVLRMFLAVYGSRDSRIAPVLSRLALDQLVDITLGCSHLSSGAMAHLRTAADGEMCAAMRLDPKEELAMSAGVLKFVQQHRPKPPKLVLPPQLQMQHRRAMDDLTSALETAYPVIVGPPVGYEQRSLLPSKHCFAAWFLSDDGEAATVLHFVTGDADLTAEWIEVLRALLLMNDAKRVTTALGVSMPDAPAPPPPVSKFASVLSRATAITPKTLEERRWHCFCKVDEAQRQAGYGTLPPTAAPGSIQTTSRGVFRGVLKGLFEQKSHLEQPPPTAVI